MMKNTQKKKITRHYHLLTKVESRKCRRVTAAIDVICLNRGGIQTNAQMGKQSGARESREIERGNLSIQSLNPVSGHIISH